MLKIKTKNDAREFVKRIKRSYTEIDPFVFDNAYEWREWIYYENGEFWTESYNRGFQQPPETETEEHLIDYVWENRKYINNNALEFY